MEPDTNGSAPTNIPSPEMISSARTCALSEDLSTQHFSYPPQPSLLFLASHFSIHLLESLLFSFFTNELRSLSLSLRTTVQPHKLINKEQSQLSLAPSLLLMLQVNKGLQKWTPTRHNKGVTINRAIAICCTCRPRPHGPQSHQPCHWQIKAVIPQHCRCFPRFGDLSILDRPTLEIFWRQKLQWIWLQNLTWTDNKILK